MDKKALLKAALLTVAMGAMVVSRPAIALGSDSCDLSKCTGDCQSQSPGTCCDGDMCCTYGGGAPPSCTFVVNSTNCEDPVKIVVDGECVCPPGMDTLSNGSCGFTATTCIPPSQWIEAQQMCICIDSGLPPSPEGCPDLCLIDPCDPTRNCDNNCKSDPENTSCILEAEGSGFLSSGAPAQYTCVNPNPPPPPEPQYCPAP